PTGFEGLIDEINGVLGTQMTAEETLEMGKEILRRERAFHKKAGFTKADDRLPEFMHIETLPPHNVRAELSGEVLDTVFGEL
ncbi:MAG: aldehyde ferredoxin oxidoreductase, partial [Anaerolineae bacterium]|nr:aldehyde ferredoxin oxidoreductase [Anaerolineae bacterium]